MKYLLSRLELTLKEEYESPRSRTMNGKVYVFAECWKLVLYGWDNLQRFAELIGFREGKRRRRLELLLKIRHLPPRERYREWTKHYVKAPNGRWVEKAPKPRLRTAQFPLDLTIAQSFS